MKIWRKRNWILLLAGVLLTVGIAVWNNREPERCPICDGLRCHAPCLVNLHTGEVGELEVYEPHPYKVGELALEQQGGYFTFVSAAGASGIRITGAWTVDMDVPADKKPVRKSLYCRECRKLLETVAWDGYTLLDLYDRDTPVVLPLRDGAEYELRCYRVTIHLDTEDNEYHLKVEGTWDP